MDMQLVRNIVVGLGLALVALGMLRVVYAAFKRANWMALLITTLVIVVLLYWHFANQGADALLYLIR